MERRNMKYTIFAVDDEESIRDLYKYTFETQGFECRTFNSAEDALKALKECQPHVVLMDVMLPGMDGITAIKQIHEAYPNIATIVISAKGDEINKVRGLDAGADDYMAKPFGVLELVARVKVHLRKLAANNEDSAVMECGEIKLNNNEHVVTVAGNEVTLTLKEYNLLKLLMTNVDNVVNREKILDEVWGFQYYGETRTLDMHIKSLRSKIAVFTDVKYIQTVRGVGYKLVVPQ